ncbi:MAG: response regulator transcription factor [Bacteroidetes bacterium]|nr:response regulator transcription factor [Bacteroidota bacterium]
MIRIAIVDDQVINRKNIHQVLERQQEIQITMEAVNGEDFLNQLKESKADDLPELVLMDIDMPVMNGIEAIAIAALKFPQIKFLVLTVFDDDDKLFEAIRAGACGYLLKDDTAEMLQDAIEIAYHKNGAPMSPAIARKTLQWLKQVPSSAAINKQDISSVSLLDTLSEREQELLRLLVAGKNYRAIADQLFISPQTVRTHISRIYEKLHINSKAQAIHLAHKYNWV